MDATPYALHPSLGPLFSGLGLDTAYVLRRAALPPDTLDGSTRSLSAHGYHRLWQAVDDEAGDPGIAVRLAQTLSMDSFDVPVFAAACSPDLTAAAQRLAEYKPLIGPLALAVQRTEHELALELHWPTTAAPPPLLRVLELVWWTAFARLATHHPVVPVAATHPLEPVAPAVEAYLGCAVEPGPHTRIAFSADDATRPFLTSNSLMWDFFEPQLRARLSRAQTGEVPTAERVHRSLLEQLPAGRTTAADVARSLGLSTRTLQRRLRDEGTSFREQLAATRESLAHHYLTRSEMPVAEISFLLGYEDPNSFFRAFQTWTGTTPETLRARTAR